MQINNKMKFILFLLGVAIICDAQIQIGDDIEGEIESEEFGSTIALSNDGQTIAIGGHRNSDMAHQAGHVRVYKLSNEEWIQLGSDLDGQAERDWFGYSVALSDDGERLIVGSHRARGASVYELKDGDWIQMGQDLDMGQGLIAIHEVAISSDGTIVAVGNSNFPQPASHTGLVRVFEWKNEEWVKIGADIIGETEHDQSGWSISLSSDGKTVAIGTINSDDGGHDSGHVRVFRLIDEEWVLLGEEIVGKGEGYSFGWSVSLSSNGNRIAVGGYGSLYFEERPCYVGVYEFTNGEWNKLGQEIDGYVNEGFGREVVLSGSGNRVAISSPSNRNCPVRIYDFIDGEWRQVGKAIKNKREFDATGYSIGMSKDGKVAAAGSILSGDGTSVGPGYVHVYDISNIIVEVNLDENCIEIIEEEEIEESKKYNLSPNPTSGYLTVQGVDIEEQRANKKLKLFDMMGRRIEGYELKENIIDLSQIPAGMYLLMIDDKIEKIIKVRQ